MSDNRVNVVVVGAGRGGKISIETLSKLGSINIIGVVDEKADAPGFKLAKDLGIPTFEEYKDIIKSENIDVIINLTGEKKVQKKLKKKKQRDSILIDGAGSEFLWTLLRELSVSDEKIFRESQEKFKAIFNNVQDGILLVDAETKQIYDGNEKICDMLGYHVEDLKNMNMKELHADEDLDYALEQFDSLRQKKIKIGKGVRIKRRDGSIFFADISLGEVLFKGKKYFVKVFRDVSKEIEIDRLKTEFVSTISHELRTPLSITKEGISLVQDGIIGEVNDKQFKILSKAQNSIDRLAKLINDLLDISRIEAGRMELSKSLFSLENLVASTVEEFQPKLDAKDIEIKIYESDKKYEVFADHDKIQQVVENLVANAIRYTEKGFIEISFLEDNGNVKCIVKDSGMGIPPQELSRIFDRFYQFGRVDGPGEKGTGLGLSIANGIIELHSGKMTAESRLDIGSTFSFSLPCCESDVVLIRMVDDAIDRAIRDGKSMSVVVNRVDFGGQLSSDQVEKVSQRIVDAMKKALRRSEGISYIKSGEFVVILDDCTKDNALKVQDRLDKSLARFVEDEGLKDKLVMHLKTVSYMDDGKSGRKLIDKIRMG